MPPGTITLHDKTINGFLKVAYSAYTGSLIARSEPFDIDPMWRALQAGELIANPKALQMAASAFQMLAELTGDDQWRRAANNARYTIEHIELPATETWFLRQETTGQVLSYPGTRVWTTNPQPLVTLRTEEGLIRLYVANHAGGEIAIEQIETQINLDQSAHIEATVGSSIAAIAKVRITVDGTDWDAPIACPRDYELTTQAIGVEDFLQWTSATQWQPEMQIELFKGDTAILNADRIHYQGENQNRVVARFEMAANFDFAYSRLIGEFDTVPPPLTYNLSGSPIVLRIQDGAGWYWQRTIPVTGGQFITLNLTWAGFIPASFQVNIGVPLTPNTVLPIQAIEFVAVREVCTLFVYHAGAAPNRLSRSSLLSRLAIVSSHTVPHTMLVGDVKLVPPLKPPYDSNVFPDRITINNNTIGAVEGNLLTAHQPLVSEAVFQFWSDSQSAYTENTGIVGPFMPAYEWTGQDSGFTWIDENYDLSWGGWQAMTGLQAAKAGYERSINTEVTTKWLQFLADQWGEGEAVAYTKFYADSLPESDVDVGIVALYAQTALYANLAGINRPLTFSILQKSLQYILERGDFSILTQPTPSITNQAIVLLETLSLIWAHKPHINYPMPSDMGNTESDFAQKLVESRTFNPSLKLAAKMICGFRFLLPLTGL